MTDDFLSEVADYYSSKLSSHGETPQGVDWNGEESQRVRFEQLCKILNDTEPFSINDLGCGYGALADFLTTRYKQFFYSGFDVSEQMIQAARQHCRQRSHARFLHSSQPDALADFTVASGIFNVRLSRSPAEWRNHMECTLDVMDRVSSRGFAFNCLTSYSDENKVRDYLYYADPSWLFDHCKRRYSRNVALLHDYDLYEFTILVRKRT